jgi:hypothetical protein
MARGVPHSDEIRAAVLASLLAGQSVGAIADEYQLPESTVRGIRDGEASREVVRAKKDSFGGLVADYLEESLITLKAQVVFARDTQYLRKQPASELAVLHGVIADKSIRILSAIEPEEG